MVRKSLNVAAGKGMSFVVEGNVLVIRMPMKKATLSKSGKSYLVCTTGGNVNTGIKVDGKDLMLGVNGYTPLA